MLLEEQEQSNNQQYDTVYSIAPRFLRILLPFDAVIPFENGGGQMSAKLAITMIIGLVLFGLAGCLTSREPQFEAKTESVAPEVEEARKRVPADGWHAERVENIRKEGIQQLVENLANFDDMHLATTTTGSVLINGSYDAAVHKVTHLFRVRRLLAIEKESPGTVTRFMVTAYAKVQEAWPAAYRDWTRRDRRLVKYGPLEMEKAEMRGIVATYFMGESGDPALLGVLLDGYQTHQGWLKEYKRAATSQCPVPPAFTLYAIHRLVSAVPEDSLRLEARSARKSYLSWAEDHIPAPAEVEVCAWNAKYDESDPFLMITGRRGILLRDQPKMVMKVYPTRFKDRTGFEAGFMPDLTQQGEEWRDQLFVAARAIIKDRER